MNRPGGFLAAVNETLGVAPPKRAEVLPRLLGGRVVRGADGSLAVVFMPRAPKPARTKDRNARKLARRQRMGRKKRQGWM